MKRCLVALGLIWLVWSSSQAGAQSGQPHDIVLRGGRVMDPETRPADKEAGALREEAWKAWEDGDVPRASRLALRLTESETEATAGHHLLFLCAFVTGNYEGALRHYRRIDATYARYAELDEPVVHAYLHLGRYADAERFARTREMESGLRDALAQRAKRPLKVTLEELTVIPFAEHPLSEYFPGFNVEVEGQEVVAHIDTGGTFLIMGPTRAKELGIELTEAGEGYHGQRRVKLLRGVARSFRLGAARLENVPVVGMPTLTGAQDFIIFGTNILQQFLSTLDYPNRRMILSPRDNPEVEREHLAMLPGDRVEVPFYMWGDHYMFARGGVGDHRGLNFFIDSGLVSLHPDESGGLRQAAFTTSAEDFVGWGVDSEEVGARVFEAHVSISLGSLEQAGHLFVTSKNRYGPFGGVRIDGLLSHAFLKRYAWTLDFSKRKYIFSQPAR